MEKNKTNIAKRRLIKSYITSVISISLVLTLVGAASVFGIDASNIARYFKENMVVSVIFRQSVPEAQAAEHSARLAKAPYVKSSDFIPVSRGEDELKALLGEDFLSVFKSSPVPVSVDLHLDGEAVTMDSLNVIRKEIMKDKLVEDVVYQESLVEALNSNLRRIIFVVSVVIILLFVISFALISNTVRLNIYTRRFTIHTMRLVGASRSFIRRPFVRQAVVQGAISGIMAVCILLVIMGVVRRESPLLFSLFSTDNVLCVFAGTVLLGIALCTLSATFVVNKLAYSTNDELYY